MFFLIFRLQMFLDFGLEWANRLGHPRLSRIVEDRQAAPGAQGHLVWVLVPRQEKLTLSLGPRPLDAVETGGHSCVKASVQNSTGEKPCFR